MTISAIDLGGGAVGSPDTPDVPDLGGGAVGTPDTPDTIDLTGGDVPADDPSAAYIQMTLKSPMVQVLDGVTTATRIALGGSTTTQGEVETIIVDFRGGGSAVTILGVDNLGADSIIIRHAPETLADVNISHNQLTGAAIDAVFEALPDRTGLSAGTILIGTDTSENPGVGDQTNAIATAKNWTVVLGD